jgi:hypothetical protein
MSYQEDTRFVGAFIRGGDWEVGLRVARNVMVDAGHGGKLSELRVSLADFAKDAGVSQNTVAKYLAAWEWAAKDGYVAASADLAVDDEYDWESSGLTQDDWKGFYTYACDNAPPWNPDRKPLEPRKSPERHVSKTAITEAIKNDPTIAAEAIKSDPKVRSAARKAIREVDAEAVEQDDVDPVEVLDYGDELEYRMVEAKSKIRSASILLGRAAEDLLGFDPTEDVVQVMKDHMVKAELLQARISCGSIDNELVALLESNEA